ncbi:MAG: hypothetical protein QM783_10505 [Phycisphaerales bacterium]
MSIRLIALSTLAVAATASVSLADFHDGQSISITGNAGPQFATSWGTGAGQGLHNLGGSSEFWDANFSQGTLPVFVTSVVNNPYSLSLTVDFSSFFPGDFSELSISVPDLKQDGSIINVFASQGTVVVNPDGNGFSWIGSGSIQPPSVTFEITQTPAPGAAAVLALGGLAASRRRRA